MTAKIIGQVYRGGPTCVHDHYKFSALWSLESRDMSRPNALAQVRSKGHNFIPGPYLQLIVHSHKLHSAEKRRKPRKKVPQVMSIIESKQNALLVVVPGDGRRGSPINTILQ